VGWSIDVIMEMSEERFEEWDSTEVRRTLTGLATESRITG
jgi:hypothetical protein